MDVAIGLPATIPGVERDQLLEWARRAEARGFSSLATLDRIVYPNYEPLIALAAAAAVTERIGLLDRDPDRALSRQRRARGQAGRDAPPPLERAPDARRRRRRARGRLRGLRRGLPHPRAGLRRDARDVEAGVGGRVVRDGGRRRAGAAARPPGAADRRLGRRRLRARRHVRRRLDHGRRHARPAARRAPRSCGRRGRRRAATASRASPRSRTSRSATARARRRTATSATTTSGSASTRA